MSAKDNHPACQSPMCGCMDVCAVMDAAEKARLDERELCAKAAEPTTLEMYAPTHGAWERGYQQGRIDAVAAIRSRSK